MTSLDRQELRRLLGKATPGPWWVSVRLDASEPDESSQALGIGAGPDDDPTILATTPGCASFDNGSEPDRWEPDAELIVAAVNALPELLDRLEEARRLLADHARADELMGLAAPVHEEGEG